MREILFRGKRADNEMWIYGDLLQSTDIVNCAEISEHTGMGVRYDIIPETVGQYTGLTDKNGDKIFEGDIVKHYNHKVSSPECDIGVIFWEENDACFKRTSVSDEKNIFHQRRSFVPL
jgi:uncharacterized phage protein (TIGR01671 family)